MTKFIRVIAGNRTEFEIHLRKYKLDSNAFRYISDAIQLRGLNDTEVVCIGTYKHRIDWDDIRTRIQFQRIRVKDEVIRDLENCVIEYYGRRVEFDTDLQFLEYLRLEYFYVGKELNNLWRCKRKDSWKFREALQDKRFKFFLEYFEKPVS